MVFSLAGLLGFLIFVAMICIGVIFLIIALLLKYIWKKQFVSGKLLKAGLVFFAIGVIGSYAAESIHSFQTKHALDDYIGWFSLLVAIIISVFILLKKNPNPIVK